MGYNLGHQAAVSLFSGFPDRLPGRKAAYGGIAARDPDGGPGAGAEIRGPWAIHELPFQWSPDGSRAWEEELQEVYRKGVRTVEAHLQIDIRSDNKIVLSDRNALLGRRIAFVFYIGWVRV